MFEGFQRASGLLSTLFMLWCIKCFSLLAPLFQLKLAHEGDAENWEKTKNYHVHFGVIMASLPFRRQSGASFKISFSSGWDGKFGFVCFLWIFGGWNNSHNFNMHISHCSSISNNEIHNRNAAGNENLRQSYFHLNFPAIFELWKFDENIFVLISIWKMISEIMLIKPNYRLFGCNHLLSNYISNKSKYKFVCPAMPVSNFLIEKTTSRQTSFENFILTWSFLLLAFLKT